MLRIFSIFVIMSMVQIAPADAGCWYKNAVGPGYYRNLSSKHPCRPGCYCEGHDKCANKNWTAGDIAKGCQKRWPKIKNGELKKIGVHLCPDYFRESDESAKAVSDCYFTSTNGHKVHNITVTCPPGQYLPKESETCIDCPAGYYCPNGFTGKPSKDKDQGEILPVGDGKTTNPGAKSAAEAIDNPPVECPAGQYANGANSCENCPAGFYCPGWNGETSPKNACPDPRDTQYFRLPETYPAEYYATDKTDTTDEQVVKFKNIQFTGWHTKLTKIEDCSIRYDGENKRGYFRHDGIRYNNVSNRYDHDRNGSSDLYYLSAKPGYYLTERYLLYGSTTPYCEDKTRTGLSMLYRQAQPCPSDKWCAGVKETKCSAGTYENDMGLEDAKDVTCARGQYLPANSLFCALCDRTDYCEGGNFKTSNREQGRKKTFTQAQLLYGPDGKKSKNDMLDDICWLNTDPILYKKCVLGIDNGGGETLPPSSGNDDDSGNNPRDGATPK